MIEFSDRFHGFVRLDGGLVLAAPAVVEPSLRAGCGVVLRGYIGDRAELARRLAVPDGSDDATLLAHAFRRWGPETQARVSGEYAAVVSDSEGRRALVTHDALGLTPLFYRLEQGGVRFSTALIDLLDSDALDRLDDDYIAQFLVSGAATTGRTPYRPIKRLPPGRSLYIEGGRVHDLRTWSLKAIAPLRMASDDDYEARFLELFEEAVRSSLSGAVRPWISLSGGLDSSSVACVARRVSDAPLSAYSIVSPDAPQEDETHWMRQVVESQGLAWEAVDAATMLPFSSPPGPFHGEPTSAVIEEAEFALRKALLRAAGADVMLTGHGGDTVLCSSPGAVPTHIADGVFEGRPFAALRELVAWKSEGHEERSWSYWMSRSLVRPSLDHLRGRPIATSDRVVTSPPWFAAGFDFEESLRNEDDARGPRSRTPGRRALSDGLRFCAMAIASTPYDRTACPTRNPLMHRPLVEFMAAIPWEQKLRPRCDRYLHRRAMKGILPERIRRRAGKAHGSAAMVEGLRRSPAWIERLCDSPRLAERGIVDRERWRASVRQTSVGQTHGDRFFLAAVAVEIWLQQLEEHVRAAPAKLEAADLVS